MENTVKSEINKEWKKTILIADFSWIQGYLFNIKKNKTATKRLKWRSFFIDLILEEIKEYIKKNKVCNWEAKEYITSGWKFILICDKFNEEKFNIVKKEIEDLLLKSFYGELKIIFWKSEWDEKKESFKEALNNAYEDLERNKLQPFKSVFVNDNWEWDTEAFIFSKEEIDRKPWNVCKFTNDRLVDEEMSKIIKEEYLNNSEESISDFFWTKDFQWTKKEKEQIEMISKEAWNDILITYWLKGGNNLGIKGLWLKNIDIKKILKVKENNEYEKGIPLSKNKGIILDFNELSKNWDDDNWFNKLAILKGDIDDLWNIFQFKLENVKYKDNYKNLSVSLNKFWSKNLYDLIENKFKNKLYVIYAGWDDFLIIWRWDIIIDFYIILLNEFKAYIKKAINNKNNNEDKIELQGKDKKIHFSWAINLFSPHDTFFTIVNNTSSLLKEAKDKSDEKNKINVFWQILNNDEFIQIMEEANKFIKKFKILNKDESLVSVSTIRFLLDIWKEIKIIENWWEDSNENILNFFEYGTWKGDLFYHLWKNYSKKEKLEFKDYMDWMLLKIDNFQSLSWKNDLFKDNKGDKLIVMMNYILYKIKDR